MSRHAGPLQLCAEDIPNSVQFKTEKISTDYEQNMVAAEPMEIPGIAP